MSISGLNIQPHRFGRTVATIRAAVDAARNGDRVEFCCPTEARARTVFAMLIDQAAPCRVSPRRRRVQFADGAGSVTVIVPPERLAVDTSPRAE